MHRLGHAQVDFGEADGIIGGKLVRFHYFCMDLPHSDAPFVKAYAAEVAEAFCDGHVAAFAFFGGIPLSILYDNTRLAVSRILGDGKRERSRMFSGLQSHYLFEDRFGRPGMRMTPRVAGFKSEYPAGLKLECMADFVGIRSVVLSPLEGVGRDKGSPTGERLPSPVGTTTRQPCQFAWIFNNIPCKLTAEA